VKVTYIGHSTTLITAEGSKILTDPWFGSFTIGIRRSASLKLSYENFLNADTIIITHTHPDHCDLHAISKFTRDVKIILPRGEQKKFLSMGFKNIIPMSPWNEEKMDNLIITAIPASHPGISTLSYFIQGDVNLLFFGDSLIFDELKEIAQKIQIDIAILPVVGFEVMGKKISWDAAELVDVIRILHPRWVIASHFGYHPITPGITKRLGSLEKFLSALYDEELDSQVLVPVEGSFYIFGKEKILDGGIEFSQPAPYTGVSD